MERDGEGGGDVGGVRAGLILWRWGFRSWER